mmetsp:Transcript_139270/g.347178  ORF Transcript_139270/g.347178 Transcript_139270/m.347178 type:complete len:228 (+) Transcript_139270:959-1642(+)
MPGCQGSFHSDPAAMPAHQLHEADAIRVRCCLCVGGVDGFHCLRASCLVAERTIEDGNIIIDCLRDPHHRDVVIDLLRAPEDLHGPTMCPIATDHKVVRDFLLLEDLGNIHAWRIPAVADQDCTTTIVDVLDHLRGELYPIARGRHALVTTLASEDIGHTIGRERHHNLADDRIEARAEATAGDNDGFAIGRVEVEMLTGPSEKHLVIDMATVVALVRAHEGLCSPR